MQPSAVVHWSPVLVTDNSGGMVTLTSTYYAGQLDQGYTFQIGVTEVSYTARDPYGNTDTASFDVTINGRFAVNNRKVKDTKIKFKKYYFDGVLIKAWSLWTLSNGVFVSKTIFARD